MMLLSTKSSLHAEVRAQARLAKGIENAMTSRLSAEFNRVASEIADNINRVDFIIIAHKNNLRKILNFSYRNIVKLYGARVLNRIKQAKSLETKELGEEYEDLIARFVNRWTGRRVTSISETTLKKIQRIIDNGITSGESEADVAKELRSKLGGEFGARRARTIARTETHSAGQDAQFEVAQSAGVNLKKEWVAALDERTREDHAEIDGTEINMEERFKVGDDELLYPGDPSGLPEQIINCRCVCVYNPQE